MIVIGTFQTCRSQRRMSTIEGTARAQCVWTANSFRDRVGPQDHGHSIGAIILNGEMFHSPQMIERGRDSFQFLPQRLK